jgi:uncharacterized phage protein gp47/JayE
MFEEKTFDNILNYMLSYVSSKYPELDVREGSIIHTALAPMALEIETAYHEMDMIINEAFLETATKEYLIKHGNQVGLEINQATYGHFKGEFDVDVEIGTRFNLDEFNYSVINKISDPTDDNSYYTFELVCETAGAEPNTFLGDLTPIDFVDNLSYAQLTSVLSYGEDEEETEAYRYRLQTHIMKPPVNGNISQYEEWLGEYDGVGKYQIKPCWNGVNTVKLTILNSEDDVASDELIGSVQQHFDPLDGDDVELDDDTSAENYPQGRGMGNGQAPIGSIVTVDTAIEVPIKVSCAVNLKDGYESPIGVQEAVNNYLKSIRLVKFGDGNMPVDYIRLSAEIYKVESVESISHLGVTVKDIIMDTELASFINAVSLASNEIPVLDTENSVWEVA